VCQGACAEAEEKEVLFFEKKNQKTFACCVWHPAQRVDQKPAARKKVFWFFFSKKHFLFPVCLTRFSRIATANATMASTRAAIYLHIGRNKAGSTTLQDFFAAQRAGWRHTELPMRCSAIFAAPIPVCQDTPPTWT
jgi:hypothetical protein